MGASFRDFIIVFLIDPMIRALALRIRYVGARFSNAATLIVLFTSLTMLLSDYFEDSLSSYFRIMFQLGAFYTWNRLSTGLAIFDHMEKVHGIVDNGRGTVIDYDWMDFRLDKGAWFSDESSYITHLPFLSLPICYFR